MKKCLIIGSVLVALYACTPLINHESTSDFDYSIAEIPAITTDRNYAFAVMGDNRPDGTSLGYFLRMSDSLNIDTVYHVGDIIEYCSPLFFVNILEVLENNFHDGSLSVTVGNHDVKGSGGNSIENLDLFNYFFDIEEAYSYRVEEKDNMNFVILNSFLPGHENEIDPTQVAWLENALDGLDTSKPTFVFLHHPMFPAGYHNPLVNRDELHAIFKAHNVTAVFQGHEHLFYDEVVDGIPYYVTGGAGSELHHTQRGQSLHHFLAVSVSPNFHVDAIDIDGNIINE